MALVIFCVALVEAMRLRRSFRLGMASDYRLAGALPRPLAGKGSARASNSASRERLRIGVDRALELGRGAVIEVPRGADRLEDFGVLRAHRRQQPVLERVHPRDRDRVEIAVHARVDDADLLLHLQRRELRLLEQLGEPRLSMRCVVASRSEPNCANAAISRYCASSPLMRPATFFIALVWAEEPTRDTDSPTFTAGRMPW